MNKVLKILVVAMSLILSVSYASASNNKAADVKAEIERLFPQMPIDSVEESNIKGLYEVVAGSQILYFHPDGYLIFGEMWTKDGISITDLKRQEIMAKKTQELPLDKAVKIGNGKNIVIEISDPDCSFCRKTFDFFSKRTDVTRYIFFMPIQSPESKNKSKYIICSDNKKKAEEKVFTGKLDGKKIELSAACKQKASQLLEEHMRIIKELGVSGTPTLWVNGRFIKGANIPAIRNALLPESR